MLITAPKIAAVNAADAKYCGGVPAMERESELLNREGGGRPIRAAKDGYKETRISLPAASRNGPELISYCENRDALQRLHAHVVIDHREHPGIPHSIQVPAAAENGRMGSEPSQFSAAAAIAALKR
jgi:hypothetical protein